MATFDFFHPVSTFHKDRFVSESLKCLHSEKLQPLIVLDLSCQLITNKSCSSVWSKGQALHMLGYNMTSKLGLQELQSVSV